jgi:hypothetical protein
MCARFKRAADGLPRGIRSRSGMTMKLVRFGEWRTGLVVELPTGLHVIDVVASLGALLPEDPVSNGVLNGILRDEGSWAPLIEHWGPAGAGLQRLARVALRRPDHPGLVMRPFDETLATPPSGHSPRIVALEITELNHETASCRERPQVSDRVADQRVVALDAYRNRL